jgi:ABC-type phosphate transport system ATPase subunit
MGRRIDVEGLNIYYGDYCAVADVSMRIDTCRITDLQA